MLYWPAINHSSQSSGWKLQIVPKNQKKKYLKGDQPLRLYTTSIRKFLKEWLHFFSFTGWKVKIAVMALNYSGCQVKLPSVSTHAQQFEQHLITIFSLLLLCGPTESRFSRFREIPSIAKHLRQKKSNALFFFHPKTGWVELFFPLTSLDSFVLLVYLSVFFVLFIFFTSLRDSTHPEHMQVPWFTLPRYTPSLSYIGRSISPSFPYLKEEETNKYVLWPSILHES